MKKIYQRTLMTNVLANQSKKNTFKKLNAEQIIYSLIQSNKNKMVFNNHISQV